MTDAERAEFEERSARIKALCKSFSAAAWQLWETEPGSESEVVAVRDLREAAKVLRQAENDDVGWHAARKASHATPIADISAVADDKLARMVTNNGRAGVAKVLAQNRKMALLSSLSHLQVEDIEALINVESTEAQVARARLRLAEYERLAIEGKKDRLVHLALSNADLQKIMESRCSRQVNNQRRSGGGVVRIESGER